MDEIDFGVAVRVSLIYVTAPTDMWEAQYDEDREMPLEKLTFRPGINRDQTNYANEGGWYACNKVRFLSGFPQKLNGWIKYSADAYRGACRAMFNYTALSSGDLYNLLALGTSKKVYVENAGDLNDITPLRQTFNTPATNNCFTTTNGSNVVTVTINTHGASAGDFVTFSGVVSAVGGVPAIDLNKEFEILSTPAPATNTFSIQVATPATSAATGGGTGIIAAFQIPSGYDINTEGYGWGAGAWGGGPWGLGSTPPIFLPLRLVYFTKRDNLLLFNIRGGNIYEWPLDTAFTTRGALLTGTDVPVKVTQILFAPDNRHLLAFGCSDVGTTVRDPLLVRWADQTDYTDWFPTDLNTAGFLRVTSGSAIMTAVTTTQEIVVFTESSISSMQFTGTLDVFSIREISPTISLIAPNTVITAGNTVYWMGRDKFYFYNGRVDTLPCTLRQHIFDNMNHNQSDQFFACHNEKYNEIWWFYCSEGSNTIDQYVIFNYAESIWYYGDCSGGMTRTAWSDSPLRPYPQAASGDDNFIYNHEYGHDAGTQAMHCFITSSDVSIANGDQFSLVRRIIPDISFEESSTENPVVYLTIVPRNFPGANYMPSNQEGQAFDRAITRTATVPVERYTEQVFVRARARQIALTVESNMLGVSWQLGVPRVDARPDGRRG